MLLGDAGLVILAYYFAHYIRFDGSIPPNHLNTFLKSVIWIVPVKLICFIVFKLYRGMWRYTSIHDMLNILKASLLSTVIIVLLAAVTVRLTGFSRGVLIIDFFLTYLFISGFRIGVRLHYTRQSGNGEFKLFTKRNKRAKKILIIGAGNAGEKLLREIMENPSTHYDVVGLIDDNIQKLDHTIHGVTVRGTLQELDSIAKDCDVDELIIAAPSASAMQMRRMVNFCKGTGLSYKTLPGLYELVEGKFSVSSIREVRYEDLLGREPVELVIEQIGQYLTGKRVLISGGAGSIGSELCRQVAQFKPEKLIIVDKNESGLYETELELISRNPGLQTAILLGAIQHNGRLEKVFREQKPQVVFHAAAYKHVPMMENYPHGRRCTTISWAAAPFWSTAGNSRWSDV